MASSDLTGTDENFRRLDTDFVSGTINLDKGLQFSGERLPEIESPDLGGDTGFAITKIERASSSGEVTLPWAFSSGTDYAVEYMVNLAEAPWIAIASGLAGGNLTTSFTDTEATRLAHPTGW